MVRVKICGITTVEDALLAVEAGADAIGLVFHEPSPRHVFPEQAAAIVRALPPFVQSIGLFVNADIELVNATADWCRLGLVQLHGDESPEYCGKVNRRVIKAFRVKDITSLDPLKDYRVSGYLLDAWSPAAYGGTGMSFNWEVAKVAEKYSPIILAGGLTPENVHSAVEIVAPYAVDVSSGVESAPGKKDPDKVREFIRQAKGV
jgi:phosphoribosylanthranilate isomerase